MIDLMKQYGKKYKVAMDETWDVERDRKQEDKPWYYEIVGRKGWAYIQRGDTLAVEIKRNLWPKFKRNPSFPHLEVRDGDDFFKVLVDQEHIDKALRFIIPRKRRQLSEDQKTVLRERMAILRLKAQAGKRSTGQEPQANGGNVENDSEAKL